MSNHTDNVYLFTAEFLVKRKKVIKLLTINNIMKLFENEAMKFSWLVKYAVCTEFISELNQELQLNQESLEGKN